MWNRIKKIIPGKTVVMVTDMQNQFVSEGGSMFSEMGNKMIPRLASFLNDCRKSNIEIMYCANENDSESGKIHASLAPAENETVITKQNRSAFFNTNLHEVLQKKGIEVYAITGVLSDHCCLASAFDVLSYGYKVAFLSDLTGTIAYPDLGYGLGDAELQQKITLGNVAYGIGHVLTSEEFLTLVKV